MDYGHKQTDLELIALEMKISNEYEKAAKSAEEKLNAHLKKFAKLDKEYAAKVKSGEMTRDKYLQWRKSAMMRGQIWKDTRDVLVSDMNNANKIAIGLINNSTIDAYALNMNYGTYEIESGTGLNTSFSLYDHATVENLMRDDPQIIPQAKLDIPLDKRWNRKKLTSAITQGILTGESIPDIAKRLSSVADMNAKAAIRNARTYTTAAENKGRVDSYQRAQNMGIKLRQEWMATIDMRTRSSHRQLDGEKQEVGHKFSNGCRYPGDPEGKPWEIYNCRCTLVASIDGFDDSAEQRFSRLPEGMSYEEWKGVHEKQKALTLEQIKTFDDAKKYFSEKYGIRVADDIALLDFDHVKIAMQGIDGAIQEFPELNGHIEWLDTRDSGYMCSDGRNIYFNRNHFAKGKSFSEDFAYQAGAHESGHCLDMIICEKVAAKENNIGLTTSALRHIAKSDWDSNVQARKIVSKAISNVKKTNPQYKVFSNKDFRMAISYYSLQDTSETLAEAIGNEVLLKRKGINSHRKSELGHAVGAEIFKLVKEGVKQ